MILSNMCAGASKKTNNFLLSIYFPAVRNYDDEKPDRGGYIINWKGDLGNWALYGPQHCYGNIKYERCNAGPSCDDGVFQVLEVAET